MDGGSICLCGGSGAGGTREQLIPGDRYKKWQQFKRERGLYGALSDGHEAGCSGLALTGAPEHQLWSPSVVMLNL